MHSAGPVLNLTTANGRLEAVCCIIQIYRLMTLMVSIIPPLEMRQPLWEKETRGQVSIFLMPCGADKTIAHFKAFSRDSGTDELTIKNAYLAAAAAAAEREALGLKPFLVSAAMGPFFTSSTFTVQTRPLGYCKWLVSEQVNIAGYMLIGRRVSMHETSCMYVTGPP